MTGTIRVLLVDDHPIVRDGYARILSNTVGISVVGEAENGEDAYKRYTELMPDVVVLDLNMPGQGGMEAMRKIIARDAAARILVFTLHDSQVMVSRAVEGGAMGYLTKRSAPAQMVEAIRTIYAGRPYFDNTLIPDLVNMKLNDPDPVRSLSQREFQIFRLLAEGNTVNEIAVSLHISPKTVGVHQTHIMSKLGLANAAQLARLAIRCGVVEA